MHFRDPKLKQFLGTILLDSPWLPDFGESSAFFFFFPCVLLQNLTPPPPVLSRNHKTESSNCFITHRFEENTPSQGTELTFCSWKSYIIARATYRLVICQQITNFRLRWFQKLSVGSYAMSKMYNYTEVLNALVWILLLVSESVNVFIYAAVSSFRNLPPL